MVQKSLLLLSMVALFAGCQSKLPLMPTPEVLKDPRFDLFTYYQSPDELNLIRTGYVTTRAPSDKATKHYQGRADALMHFGGVELKLAEAEDVELLYQQSTASDRETDFRWHLNAVEPLASRSRTGDSLADCASSDGVEPFLDAANGWWGEFADKNLTLYVHGANNTFYNSVSRGGQYQYFTGDNAPVLTFAWPSPGSIFGYNRDKAEADAAGKDIACLIVLLAAHTDVERFNIIAYSAGGRAAGRALALLGESGLSDLRLGHIYLAASDQPLEDFVRDLPGYFDLLERLTVTTASNDPVLALSKFTDSEIRLGADKEGSSEKLAARGIDIDELRRLLNSDKVTLIDLSQSDIAGFKMTHGAWYENPWVSTDVMVALLTELGPAERGLLSYEDKGFTAYYFPENYLEVLKQQLLPES